MSILTKGSGMIRKSGRCSKTSKLTKDFGMIINSRSCKIISKLSFGIYISIYNHISRESNLQACSISNFEG